MDKYKKGIILLILCFLLVVLYNNKSKASGNIDLFNQIIRTSNSKIVENGIKVEYLSSEKKEDECKRVLNNLSLDNAEIRSLTSNDEFFYLEFDSKEIEGYIEGKKYDKKSNKIVINITEKININDLKNLNSKVKIAIGNNTKESKQYQYVKAELSNNNLDEMNSKLAKELKAGGATNIESLNINKGQFTVANTYRYKPTISNGKLVDFSYALCNYSSGNYIIVGTPEIITSY